MSKARLALLTLGSALLVGCGGDQPEELTGSVQVLDSAGVEVIVNHLPDTPFVLREAVRVGVVEGDPSYQFHRIRTVAADRRGGFWVVDGQEAVRHYAADGGYVGRVGWRGVGPGEAEGYRGVAVGDTEVIVSGYPGSLQQFSSDGTLVASRPWTTEEGALISPLGFSDDRWVLTAERTPSDGGALFRTELRVVTAATVSDDLRPVRSFQGRLRHRGGGRGPFFHGDPSFAVDTAGHVFVSDTLEYRITQYRLDGTVVRIVRRETEPQRYDEQVVQEVEIGAEQLLRYGPWGDRDPNLPINREALRRMVSDATPTNPLDDLPYIDRILVSPAGFLWVERADRHPRPGMRAVAHASGYVRWAWRTEWTAESVFDVFNPGGRYVGTATFPREYVPTDVDDDRVFGVWYGEYEVESVVVYARRE